MLKDAFPSGAVPRWLAVLVAAALVAGCASPGAHRAPPATVDPATLGLTDQAGYAPAAGWWKAAADPVLDRLIDTALAQSPSLRVLDARLAEARAQAGLAESRLGPQVDATASVDRERYSLYGLTPPPLAGNYATLYRTALNASWDLDLWGRRRAELQAALGATQAQSLENAQARLKLVQAVMAQYTALQRQVALRETLLNRQRLAGERVALLAAQARAGVTSPSERRPAEMRAAQLGQQIAANDSDIARSRHALAALTGQPPAALAALKPLPLSVPPTVSEARLSTALLGQRPDIMALRARAEAGRLRAKAARAAFYPDLKLSAFIGLSAQDIGDLLKRDASILGVLPAITLPIFNSGALRSQLSQEEARYAQAIENYNQTVYDALRDTADALSTLRLSADQLREANAAQAAAARSADAARQRQRAGLTNGFAVLDAADLREQGAAQVADALAARRLAWIQLNTQLGGGVPLSANLEERS